MQHIRKIDSRNHTVIMVQVENEVGMLEDARDHCDAANEAFRQHVPKELIDYLVKNKDLLAPELRQIWQAAGGKTSGNWEDIFGKGLATDEIFMAWFYARYINQVAAAGKTEYPLPMFVNAALIRPNYKPGQYPSAGPLPHLFDVWRAAAPQIDFFAPDIYFDFIKWCQKYHTPTNPLFIPETGRDLQSEVNVFYVIGKYDAIGFCPFAIELTPDPVNAPISKSYEVLSQLAPLILEKQGSGQMTGILLDKENQTQDINLGSYTLKVSHSYTFKWTPRPANTDTWPIAGGIIISTSPDEYIVAGTGLIITFSTNQPSDKIAGIIAVEEGKYVNGYWLARHRLNGDENHQGRHLNLPFGGFSIQHVKLYCYE
jgi:beta-galactosidase GanA